jgi:hypothetical protein
MSDAGWKCPMADEKMDGRQETETKTDDGGL